LTGRALLVLLALLGVLLSVVIWFDVPKKEDAVGSTENLATIFPVALDAVKAMETEGLQAPVRIEHRGGSSWEMVMPFDAEVDPREVKSLYEGLTGVPIQKVVQEAGADLAKFGLKPPVARIRVFAAERPQPYELAVGRVSPVGDGRYADDGSGRVLLVGSAMNSILERTPDSLRERRLLPVDAQLVRRLTVADANNVLSVEKSATGWKLVRPLEDQADGNAVDTFVRAAVGLLASEFPRSDSARSGFGDPGLTITLEFEGDEKPMQAEVGAPDASGRCRARRSTGGFNCLVDDSAVSNLRRSPQELRERRITFVEASDVREIVIRSNESGDLTARRDATDGAWSMREGSGPWKEATSRAIDDLLDRLRWLRAESFESGSDGAAPAKRTLLLHGATGELGRLEFLNDPPVAPGAPAGDGRKIRVRSSWRPGLVLEISEGGLGALPLKASDLDKTPDTAAKEPRVP